MVKGKSLRHAAPWVSSALLLAGLATPVLARGFKDESLTLRLPAALSRFATYGDVAGLGGASAGSKWSSSVNPASVAWESVPGDLHLVFSPQYSALAFENGSRLDVCAEAFTWDLGELGVIQPSLAQVRSNTATTRQGLDFRMDMDYAQVQWAKRFGDDWAFGANLNFTKSETRYDLGPLDLDVSESSGETYGFRLGTLHRPAPRLLAGLVFDYAFSPGRTTLFDFMGTGVGNVRVKDTTHQYVLRPGVSYEYAKDSAVYADYQYGAFCDETGHLEVHRFYMGVDHRVRDWLFLRGGTAMDVRGNTAWAVGLGIYPSERVSIDVGYQQDMFPELEPEFGRSKTLTISVSITF